jgi:DNA-binding response OmpR family regulator
VEDDDTVAFLVSSQLERFGYQVHRATDFRRIVQEVQGVQPDLILLDINLPYYDGYYWCRQIRTVTKAPIVFLSARGNAMDQVLALDSGGDEYITKPFDPDLMLAKIRAILRRTYGEYAELSSETGRKPAEVYHFGDVAIDLRRAVIERADLTESLTKTELSLLRQLLEADGAVVTRDALLEELWDDTTFVDDNTLTVNVTRLRKKLAPFGLHGAVVTVRGLGYRWFVEPDNFEDNVEDEG